MKSQTINLLRKEIKLGNTAQTLCWIICCFGMFFIPNYPSYIGPFYITLCIMMTFALNQSSHDILYTVLLPVRKIDTVKARFIYCGLIEVLSLVLAIIPYFIKLSPAFPEVKCGIPLNIAYFGLQFFVYAVFNLLFLGNVYKDPLKPGLRYLFAAIMYFVFYALCELPVWMYFRVEDNIADAAQITGFAKAGYYLYTSNSSTLGVQLLVLLGGILIYALVWCITFKKASKQFQKYDM